MGSRRPGAESIELRDVAAFIAVAEEMHFGRAATRLGVSQPPLSRRIMTLEKMLGVQLFTRGRNGVRLTKSGEVALREAYALMRQSDDLQQSARAVGSSEQTNLLRVGFLPSALYEILPRVLAQFHGRYPSVDVALKECRAQDAVKEIRNGRLDVSFVRTIESMEPLSCLRLRSERCVVALPVGHPLEHRERLHVRDLFSEPLVLPSGREYPRYLHSIVEQFRNHHCPPRIVHETISISSLLEVVAKGLAVSLVPTFVSHSLPPKVVVRPLVEVIPIIDLSIAWDGRHCSPLVHEFISITQTLLSAEVSLTSAGEGCESACRASAFMSDKHRSASQIDIGQTRGSRPFSRGQDVRHPPFKVDKRKRT